MPLLNNQQLQALCDCFGVDPHTAAEMIKQEEVLAYDEDDPEDE